MSMLTVTIIFAVLATAGVLVTGIATMANGGEFDRHHSHQLMFARVALQGLALLLVVIALLQSAR